MTDFMQENQANSGQASKTATYFWMGASIVLLVLLIIVAVFNPFQGGQGAQSANGEIVATVNGVEITKDDLYDEMYVQSGQMSLETMVISELIRQEAVAKNVEVTDDEINEELEKLAAANNTSIEDMISMITAQMGVSEEYIRSNVTDNLQLRKLLLPQIEVTEEQVRQYYDDHQDEFTTPEQVRASHILVETKEEAEEIIAELNGGADFAELAQERGTDGTASRGGDLDYFSRGRMVAEFEEAAFAMEVGEITQEPVETQHGFHVIMKTDHREESVTPFEEMEEQIRTQLEDEQIYNLYQPLVTELRQKANIEYTES